MIPRKTKIICTIGPATQGVDNLVKLINSGMDAARLNFSHGTHDLHQQHIADIREAARLTGREVAILQDLQGPKIRIGMVENGGVELIDGQDFIITIDEIGNGTPEKVSTSYKPLVHEVKSAKTILLDDGYIILEVKRCDKSNIYTKVVKGGILKDKKGIIVPGVKSSAPSLSSKDIDDLKFGLSAGVDVVALSFVRSARDIVELKTAMKIFGRNVPIISKIERLEALGVIDDIIKESDMIMVARGDLGLEMPAEQVPIIQKDLVEKCNYHGKPVIIATQMLESMIENPRPTRAEASDVANAVVDGADCVMLSGETSIGRYPCESVDYMHRIIKAIEDKYGNKFEAESSRECREDISDALSKASCVIAQQINATAIVTSTSKGYTAKNIAKYRPVTPVLALTENEETVRQLSLIWGVTAIHIPEDMEPRDVFADADKYLFKYGFINKGDYVVYATGYTTKSGRDENLTKVYHV